MRVIGEPVSGIDLTITGALMPYIPSLLATGHDRVINAC